LIVVCIFAGLHFCCFSPPFAGKHLQWHTTICLIRLQPRAPKFYAGEGRGAEFRPWVLCTPADLQTGQRVFCRPSVQTWSAKYPPIAVGNFTR